MYATQIAMPFLLEMKKAELRLNWVMSELMLDCEEELKELKQAKPPVCEEHAELLEGWEEAFCPFC
jgi:hypothetical protein